jgi:hypothetical protein
LAALPAGDDKALPAEQRPGLLGEVGLHARSMHVAPAAICALGTPLGTERPRPQVRIAEFDLADVEFSYANPRPSADSAGIAVPACLRRRGPDV